MACPDDASKINNLRINSCQGKSSGIFVVPVFLSILLQHKVKPLDASLRRGVRTNKQYI